MADEVDIKENNLLAEHPGGVEVSVMGMERRG